MFGRLLSLVMMLAAMSASGGTEWNPAAEQALRKALGSSAEWTMERTLGESGRQLRSSGTVTCTVNSGIVWKVTSPFEFTVTMTPDSMAIADEDGVRVRRLDELPHYVEIRKRTDRFANGDRSAFDGLFEVESQATSDGGWRLRLEPEISAMKLLVNSVELSGNDLPTNAVLVNADGGKSVIRFRERSDVR